MKMMLIAAAAGALLVSGTQAQQMSVDDLARELSNPVTPMSTIGNHIEYRAFTGNFIGSDNQDSWSYVLQPSFPFDQGDGRILALRPAFPLVLEQSVFDPDRGYFTDKSGLGDIAFDFIYGKTSPTGLITLGGLYGVLPTATEDELGKDQWQAGPEILVGQIGEQGILAGLFFHAWDFAGEDDYSTNLSSFQYIYAYNLQDGYQIAAAPLITYDWDAEKGDHLTLPLGIGVAKTVIAGELPLKLQAQVFYYIEQPDTLGFDWGFKLSLSPVVANPFVR